MVKVVSRQLKREMLKDPLQQILAGIAFGYFENFAKWKYLAVKEKATQGMPKNY